MFFRDGTGGWDHMDLPHGVQNEIYVCGQTRKTGSEDMSPLSDLWLSEKECLEGQVSTYARPWRSASSSRSTSLTVQGSGNCPCSPVCPLRYLPSSSWLLCWHMITPRPCSAWLVRLSLCCLHCTLQYGVPHVQPQLSFLSTSVASVTSVKLSSELCHSVPVSAACQT